MATITTSPAVTPFADLLDLSEKVAIVTGGAKGNPPTPVSENKPRGDGVRWQPVHWCRLSAKTRQWPLCRASRKGATAVDRRRRGNIPRLGADAIDTFRASRRVGRADESSSWPAVEGSVRFDVSRRRCARRVYVLTFRGDAARGALTFRRFAGMWLRPRGRRLL